MSQPTPIPAAGDKPFRFAAMRGWGLPGLVAVYAGLAFAVAPHGYPVLVLAYAQQALILVFLFGVPVAGIMHNPRSPLTGMRDVLRNNGVFAAGVMLGAIAGFAAFTTLKITFPEFVPFYADPLFAGLDHWLHFGNPGEWAHALVPDFLNYTIAYLYGPVWMILWFGLLALVALQSGRAFARRYLWTMALSFILLGTVSAALFSSVGPVFYADIYGGNRFEALMALIRQSSFGEYMSAFTTYLLNSHINGGFNVGGGISAMPSMHLAVVTLNAHMLTSHHRWLGVAGWAYVAVILLGSVLLGWHYAIDGYLSIALVSLIWWATGRLMPRG